MSDVICSSCAAPSPSGARYCDRCGGDLTVAYGLCGGCGHSGRPGARYCAACGARLARPPAEDECRSCRAVLGRSDRFCAACGAGVSGAPAALPDAARAPQPAPAIAAPGIADEERKLVTVLFADVSGFTAMSEKLDPEQVRDVMDRCFEALTREITSRGGTIDKYIGDAVMAYFGVPVAHEDDAPQAVRAALGMQDALGRFSETLQSAHGLTLAMRIGLNTGKVLAGLVGGEGHKDFTIYGDTVNTASRLEHAAAVGTVLISHDTYLAVRGWFEIEELPPIKVKGKEKALKIYRVGQERLRPSALGMRGIEGVDVPMVGRDLELRVLLEWLSEARREGRARVVTVTGQAGIGKSRLVAEVSLRWAREGRPITLLKGRVLPPGSGAPLNLLRDLASDLLDLDDASAESLSLGAVAAGVERGDADALARVLSGGSAAERPEERELALRRAFRAVRALLERRAATSECIVVCEDVHWAPDAVLDFIDHVGASLTRPVLLLCLARPDLFDRRPLWAEGKSHQYRVDLRQLSDMAASELVELILQRVTHLPPALVEAVVARAGGNPFFIEELVKVMLETGVVQRGEDPSAPWTLDGDWESHFDVPASIQGLLQSRVDALPRHEKAVLAHAAIVGRVLWTGAVSRITGSDAGPALAGLRAKELLVGRETSRLPGEQELLFRNSLVHEVVYDRILVRDRRPLHEKVALWLEEKAGGPEAARTVTGYALHLERAGRLPAAVRAYRAAGARAQAQFANGEARALFGRAAALLDDEAVRAAIPASEQLGLFRDLGEVSDLSAAYDEALVAYGRALGLTGEAGASGDERAAIHCGIGDVHVRRGDLEAARTEAERALEIPGEPKSEVRAEALELMGRVSFYQGDYPAAEARCSEALDAGPGDRLRAQTLRTLSMVHIRRGELDASQRAVTEALALARSLGDEMLLGRMRLMQGNLHNLRGESDAAVSEYDDTRNSSERLGDLHTARMCHNNLGELLGELGRWDDAFEPLQRSITLCNVLGVRNQVSDTHRLLGQVLLHRGAVAEARGEGERALALAEETGERSFAAEALRFLGQVALSEGDDGALDRAEGHLERAAAVLTEMGSDVLLGKCLYHFGESLLTARLPGHERRAREQARQHIDRAALIFERLGMDADRARARQALATLEAS